MKIDWDNLSVAIFVSGIIVALGMAIVSVILLVSLIMMGIADWAFYLWVFFLWAATARVIYSRLRRESHGPQSTNNG